MPEVSFKIIERGGKTLVRQIQDSNPTATRACSKNNCIPCSQQGGARLCHKSNITYQYTCKVTGAYEKNLKKLILAFPLCTVLHLRG